MKIVADASLPNLMKYFTPPFQVQCFNAAEELPLLLKNSDILVCRSTLKVTAALLEGTSIQCVATASSGTDHIDHTYLQQHSITLLDAKGSNADAVADYVLSTVAYLKQVKRLHGRSAGIIGMGVVGSKVYNRLRAIGFNVLTFDPPRAQIEPSFISCQLQDLTQCDLICIHANLHDTQPFPSHQLINDYFFTQLNPHAILLNAARGGIVDEEALLKAPRSIVYCTDVYAHEPSINPSIVNRATLCTPHIAGHSIEAKERAVAWISQALHRIYQVPYAPSSEPVSTLSPPALRGDWKDIVLSLYNPSVETHAIKMANNKKDAFLTLRKAHCFRHDFNYYDLKGNDLQALL